MREVYNLATSFCVGYFEPCAKLEQGLRGGRRRGLPVHRYHRMLNSTKSNKYYACLVEKLKISSYTIQLQ